MPKTVKISFVLKPQGKKKNLNIANRIVEVIKTALQISGLGDPSTLTTEIVDEEEKK